MKKEENVEEEKNKRNEEEEGLMKNNKNEEEEKINSIRYDVKFPDEMTILECFWLVTKMAVPLVIGMLLYLLVQLTNTWFIGNLNEPVVLAGVGMGNMLINVLCFAVIQGINGALETFVS